MIFLHCIIICLIITEFILLKKLIKHPSYKNQMIGFDLKYDVDNIVNMSEQELSIDYKKGVFLERLS